MANAEDAPIYLTPEGQRRLEQRLQDYTEQFQRLRPPAPVDEAQDTIDQADELESADDVARLTDMIAMLQDTLGRARPLGEAPNDGIVRHGSTVIVRDAEGTEHQFKLLDGVEVEAGPEEISLDSPMGRALLNRARGQELTVALPHGEARFTIVSVRPYRSTAV
jgi:transcription elongation GreA/GreB family factor